LQGFRKIRTPPLKCPPEPNSFTPKIEATGFSETSEHSYYPTKPRNLDGYYLNYTHREGLRASPLKFFPFFEKNVLK
jgi:hypothetical protein